MTRGEIVDKIFAWSIGIIIIIAILVPVYIMIFDPDLPQRAHYNNYHRERNK